MNTQHQIAMLVNSTLDDEACREHVIEHMLSVFPDAIVEGAPTISTSDSAKTVRVVFCSPMFDLVAEQVMQIIDAEFDSLKTWLNSSSELTQGKKREYSYIIDALANRVNAIFGERE